MTFGRAVMFGRTHRTPLPDLIDDESVGSGVSSQPPTTLPSLALFVQSCKLFKILHDVLDLLNTCKNGSHNDDARWEDLIIQILTINRQLELFYMASLLISGLVLRACRLLCRLFTFNSRCFTAGRTCLGPQNRVI